MRPRLFICIIINLVIASAEGADWPMYRFEAARTALQPIEIVLTPVAVRSLQKLWSFRPSQIGDPDLSETNFGFTASPTVYGGIVYVGHHNGYFYALNKWTGRLFWRYPPGGAPPLTAEPTEACISRGGRPGGKWGIGSSAAIASGVQGKTVVIFGAPDPSSAGDGSVYALNATTGQLIWRSDRVARAAKNEYIGWSSPVVANGKVYIGVASHCDNPLIRGRLVALDLQTGQFVADFPPFFTVPGGFVGGGIWSSPAADPVTGHVFITTGNAGFSHILASPEYTNSMVALDGDTGGLLWAFQATPPPQDADTDFGASPVLVNASCGQLAVATAKDGYVYAIEQSTGEVRWTFPETSIIPYPGLHGPVSQYASAATVGDLIFTTARTSSSPGIANTLYAMDACATDPSQRIRWAIRLDGMVGPPSVANGVLYVGTWHRPRPKTKSGRGTFYALDIFDTNGDGSPKVLFTYRSRGRIVSEPAITDGVVYVTSTDGVVRAFSVVRAFHSP